MTPTDRENQMTCVPLCYNCDTNEVQAEFSFRDGTGFCSASCETEANDVEEIYSYELDMDIQYEIYKDGRYDD